MPHLCLDMLLQYLSTEVKYLTNNRDAFVIFAGAVPAALMGFLTVVFNWVMSFERQEIAALGLFGSAIWAVSFWRCASRKAEGADLLGILLGTIVMIALVTLLLVSISMNFRQAALIGFIALSPTSVGVLLFWEVFYSSDRHADDKSI